MVNAALFNTSRESKLPKADTINPAGGEAYAYSPDHALAQLAATGTFAGTCYGDAAGQLKAVVELAGKVTDNAFLAKLAVYARQKAYMKDMPAALTLILSKRDPALSRRVFAQVADNGRVLRTMFQMLRSGVFGRKSLSSALQKEFQKWLNTASVGQLLSASIGDKPSLRDVLRCARPTPPDNERRALFGWLTQKPTEKWAPATLEDLPLAVLWLEAFRRGTESDQVRLFEEDGHFGREGTHIRWDLLSDSAKGPKVWAEIAKRMGAQALRMNLNTLQRHKVFDEPGMVEEVANRLADAEEVTRSRQFPYGYFAAYLNASEDVPQKVRSALHKAAEVACGNIPELPGPVVIGVDVSGSMSSAVTGNRGTGATSKMLCIDVAALFGAALLRRNPDSLLVPFDGQAHQCQLDPGDTILSLATRLAQYGGGATDCHLPLQVANDLHGSKVFAGCIIVSDNQSWVSMGRYGATATMEQWARFQAGQKRLGRYHPKLVCIDLQAYGSSPAAESKDILNMGGFSDAVFNVVAGFLAGEGNRFVQEVQSIEV